MDDTTPVPEEGASNRQDNDWETRYKGLQQVVAKRDDSLRTLQGQFDSLKAEHEATTSALDEYRVRDAAESEEAKAREQFEQLRERFDPKPKPVPNAQPRQWFEGGSEAGEKSDDATLRGYPV